MLVINSQVYEIDAPQQLIDMVAVGCYSYYKKGNIHIYKLFSTIESVFSFHLVVGKDNVCTVLHLI